MPSAPSKWSKHPDRARLLDLYAGADELFRGWSCGCAPEGELPAPCCRFTVSNHEPYPTAVEMEEVRHAMRAASIGPRPKRLALVDAGEPCPLLSLDGRCRIYASRPFGCRTYFCESAVAPSGRARQKQRDAVAAIGRQIADLSAAFAPRNPGPRPLTRALAGGD
jgi:hypothetical protein